MIKKLVISFLLSIFITTTGFCDSSKNELQSFLDSWRAQKKVPGVILLVSTPTKHEILTSGSTRLNGGDAITASTLFAVGSITKTFTSAMILRLEAEGRLNINDKMSQYFPQYPRWKEITIKQLLNMTSGIQNFTEDTKWVNNLKNNFKDTWTADQLIGLAYQKQDYFKPGKGWHYSNTNYVLLGKIIQKVTHQSLPYVFESQFFNPLGLKNSYYSETRYSLDILKRMAHGYDDGQDLVATILAKNLSDIGPPGGAMVMDTTDLKSWVDHLLIKKDVLPEKQLNEMLEGVPTPYNNNVDLPDSKYGLGVGVLTTKKTGQMISYAGTFPGYGSTFIWLPAHNILIITQMNVNRHGNDESSYLHFPSQSLIQETLKMLM
ncbi:MAG TPA: serine hydrolase domain-containing protein [Gammaproteobacteria bacterium]|nr:serine hydrolase domain-containing protein [Gammaproteobacteria bacterium]